MTTTALSNLRATPPEQVDTPAAAAAAVANSSPWESSRATTRSTTTTTTTTTMTTTNKAKNSSTPQGTETAQKRQRHLEAPDNDACDDADDIGDTFPVTITKPGTLLDSTGITDATERDALKCNNIFSSANVGVWYKVDGTGKPMRFSTCAVDGASTAAFYNTQILVYDNDCNDLNCVAANKIGGEGCGGTSSRVEIDSEDGTQYFVLVDHDDDTEGVTGQAFELAVIDNVPMNDYCETASQVNVGDKKMADTTNASPDDGILPAVDNDACRNSDTEMKGVWYEFIGTGKQFGCPPVRPMEEPPVSTIKLVSINVTVPTVASVRSWIVSTARILGSVLANFSIPA